MKKLIFAIATAAMLSIGVWGRLRRQRGQLRQPLLANDMKHGQSGGIGTECIIGIRVGNTGITALLRRFDRHRGILHILPGALACAEELRLAGQSRRLSVCGRCP